VVDKDFTTKEKKSIVHEEHERHSRLIKGVKVGGDEGPVEVYVQF
jgi:hypothetical protein